MATIVEQDTPPIAAEEHLIAEPGRPIVNITAFTARQKASSYVGDKISHLMGGDEPALILSQGRLVWRVPILLTTPVRGRVGVVGSLDVDAHTGSLLIQPGFDEQVVARARTLTATTKS
jgi:hypothetical protein